MLQNNNKTGIWVSLTIPDDIAFKRTEFDLIILIHYIITHWNILNKVWQKYIRIYFTYLLYFCLWYIHLCFIWWKLRFSSFPCQLLDGLTEWCSKISYSYRVISTLLVQSNRHNVSEEMYFNIYIMIPNPLLYVQIHHPIWNIVLPLEIYKINSMRVIKKYNVVYRVCHYFFHAYSMPTNATNVGT